LIEIKFAKHLMSERELGIELNRFLAVLFGDRSEIKAQQQPRREKISRGGIRRNLKHFRESSAGVRVLLGLNIGNTEDVSSVDIGARIPRLHLFEISDGVVRFPREIEGKTGELSRFAIVRVFLIRAL
jgi:hypothetical protein